MSHAAAKPFIYLLRAGSHIQSKRAKLIHLQKATKIASSDRDTLIGLAKLAYPGLVNEGLL